MNLPRNGDLAKLYQWIGAAVVGLVAGGGGSLAVDAISPPRPDLWGTMGRELRADMMRALEAHDSRIRALEAVSGVCGETMRHLGETLRDLRQEVRALHRKNEP